MVPWKERGRRDRYRRRFCYGDGDSGEYKIVTSGLLLHFEIHFLNRRIVGTHHHMRRQWHNLWHKWSISRLLYLAKELDEDDSILTLYLRWTWNLYSFALKINICWQTNSAAIVKIFYESCQANSRNLDLENGDLKKETLSASILPLKMIMDFEIVHQFSSPKEFCSWYHNHIQ